MNQYESIGSHRIYLNATYFVAYAGGTRELPKKDQSEYRKILKLPFLLQRQELSKMPLENNPNVIPLKGRDLISFIKELKFRPFFDINFDNPKNPTHLLKLMDAVAFESMKQKSYEAALQV